MKSKIIKIYKQCDYFIMHNIPKRGPSIFRFYSKKKNKRNPPKTPKKNYLKLCHKKKLKKDSSSGATSPRSVSTSTGGKVSSPRPAEKKISEMILPFAKKKKGGAGKK